VARLLLEQPAIDWDMAMIWRRGAYLSHAAKAWLDVAAAETLSVAAPPG